MSVCPVYINEKICALGFVDCWYFVLALLQGACCEWTNGENNITFIFWLQGDDSILERNPV